MGEILGSDFNRFVFRFLLGGGTGVGESPRWFNAGSAREFPIAVGESPGCSGELWVVSDDEGGVVSSGGGDKTDCLGCTYGELEASTHNIEKWETELKSSDMNTK